MAAASDELAQLRRDRAVLSLAAARRVGDPVLGIAVDGADALVAHHKGADVALGLVYVLLDVEDRVVIGAQDLLVLEDRLGRIAVVDLGQQPAPRADGRLHDHRIAQRLDGCQRRLLREGDAWCAATAPCHAAAPSSSGTCCRRCRPPRSG